MSKIKVILADFDRTLFDSSTVEHLYKRGERDKEVVREKKRLGSNLPMFEGWEEVFKELEERGIIFGIVSHNTKNFITFMTKRWGISPRVIVSRCGTILGNRRKLPKDILLRQTLEKMELTDIHSSEVLYLGGQERDILWAKKFGAKAGACFFKTEEGELLEAAPWDYKFFYPKQILSVLEKK